MRQCTELTRRPASTGYLLLDRHFEEARRSRPVTILLDSLLYMQIHQQSPAIFSNFGLISHTHRQLECLAFWLQSGLMDFPFIKVGLIGLPSHKHPQLHAVWRSSLELKVSERCPDALMTGSSMRHAGLTGDPGACHLKPCSQPDMSFEQARQLGIQIQREPARCRGFLAPGSTTLQDLKWPVSLGS